MPAACVSHLFVCGGRLLLSSRRQELRWGLQSPIKPLQLMLALLLLLSSAAVAAADAPAGIVSSQFSVDQTGAAQYQVPIRVPPGTAGVEPELSFNYGSHSSEGMMGVGWTLSGFSSISRCAVRRDGNNYPVGYTAQDRFCLDGTYLVAEPSSVYGADGSIYHPENQPWVRIRAQGQCPASGGGPCSFIAEQASGDVFEFGTSADSAIEAVPAPSNATGFPLGAIRVWAATRYVNKSGNQISFRYAENTQSGEYTPETILYTINAKAAVPLSAQRAVQFLFDDSAPIARFQGGAQIVQTKLLRTVLSCVNRGGLQACADSAPGTQVLASYALDYIQSPATQRDLLQTITESGTDGTALRPQQMRYQAPAQNAFESPSSWTTEFTWDNGWSNAESQERQMADVDGDGRYDLIGFGQTSTQYALSTGSGFATARSQKIFSRDQGYTSNSRFPRLIVDVNGDGLSDILGFGNSQVQVSLSLGDHYAEPANWSSQLTYGNGGWDNTSNIRSAADINGDGRSDIIGFGGSTVVWQLSTGDGFATARTMSGAFTTSAGYATPATNPRYLADVNGDGRADIVGFKSAGTVEVGISDGEGFLPVQTWTQAFTADSSAGWVPGQNPRYVVDMNGDGLADLVGFRNSDVVVAYSTGRSFTNPQSWTTAFTYNNGGWNDAKGTLRTLGDIDGDRLPDIIAFGNNDTLFGINRNGRFDVDLFQKIPDAFGYSSIARNPRFPADTTGSGISALIGLGDKSVQVALPPAPKPDLLIGLTNELGGTVAVSYASTIADPAVYDEATGDWTYPFRTKVGPMDVVALHTLGDGLGNSYQYRHSYQGTVADMVERGFLGFEATTVTDLQLNPQAGVPGVATRSEYLLPFPLGGQLQRIKSTVLDTGQIAAQYDYSYDPVEVSPGVFDVRKTAEDATHYNLSNSLSYQTRQTYAYDSYGNLQLLVDFGNVSDPGDDSAVCVNFSNDPINWRIGFPLDSATAPTCQISGDRCGCANPTTRDRWVYTDAAMTNTRSHAQFDSTKNGWLGSVMEWDEYGNLVIDSGAYWTTDDPAETPTTFNPLNTTFDPDFRTFAIHVENAKFATESTFDPRFGAQLTHTDPNLVVTRWTYDEFGRTLSIAGPSPNGAETVLNRWEYRSLPVGMVTVQTMLTDWSGSTTETGQVSDGLQRLIRTTQAVDAQCVIAIEQQYLAIDRLARQSLPYYDSVDAQSCSRQASPAYVVQTYDPLGRVIQTAQPDNVVTRYSIDMAALNGVVRDQVIQTDAYGSPEARSFSTLLDPEARPLRWVFPGQDESAPKPTADLGYDPLGRLVQLTAPNGVYTRWMLDSLDRVGTQSSPTSGTQAIDYAREGMQLQQTDADGRKITWTYDPIGRVASESLVGADGATRTTAFQYDQTGYAYSMGRLTSVLDPSNQLEHHYDYDPYGNRQQSRMSIDGLSFAIQVDFDPLRRAVQLTYPDNSRQRKRYSTDGFLAEVAVCLNAPDCAESSFIPYANFANYTALGSPQNISYRSGRTSSSVFHYDQLGRVLDSRTESGQGTALIDRSFDWNALNQLLASTDSLDALRSLAYTYDGAGYLKSSAVGGRSTDYRYDAIGNLQQKGDTSYQSTVTQVTTGMRAGQEVFAASYDASGNMVTRKHQDNSGKTQQWTQGYDARGRMTTIHRADPAQQGDAQQVAAFTYDYDSSLVKRVDYSSGVTSYYVSKNYDVALLADGSAVYTKYVDGLKTPVASISSSNPSLLSAVPNAPANRWIAAQPANTVLTASLNKPPAGLVALSLVIAILSFTSALLRRKRRIERMARRGAGLVRATASIAFALIFLVVQLPSQAIAAGLAPGANGPGIPVAGTTLFYFTDLVRSSVMVVDAEGNPQAEVMYGAFGEIDESASFGSNDFRAKFAGVELASEVGLYLNAGRFFDPVIGRFVSADDNRIGAATNNAVQFNRYAYGANNPVTHIDPNGGSAQSILFDIGLAAIAVASAFVPGAGIIAIAEVGAYFGASAVNHTYDPAKWNYKSWKTYAGMAAGIAITAAGLAVSIAAPEAIPEEAGALATFLAGVAADAVVGFAENATYAALGGASGEDILKQGLIGAATGAAFSAVGQGISAGIGRVTRRSTTAAAEAGEESSSLGSRSAAASESVEASSAENELGGLSCSLASFASGTPVATAAGPVPIESLALHTEVLAVDAETGRVEPHQITALYSRTAPEQWVLGVESGERIVTTEEHPFLLYSGEWRKAGDLRPGDGIRSADSSTRVVATIERIEVPFTVHNLSVEGLHNYVIGSDGLVVHNVNHGCTSKNSKELRKNMVKGGREEPDFANAAHHIVESTDPHPKMVKARAHLQKLGLDINHRSNGVFLARSSKVQKTISSGRWSRAYPHSRVHTKNYKIAVWSSIKKTTTRREARSVLRSLRKQLMRGNFPAAGINWP